MKINAVVIVGIIFAVLAVSIFAVVVVQQPFPNFKPSSQSDRYVNINQAVGPDDSRFMWNNDSLALVAQAFALFAAAAATLGLLRIDGEAKPQ